MIANRATHRFNRLAPRGLLVLGVRRGRLLSPGRQRRRRVGSWITRVRKRFFHHRTGWFERRYLDWVGREHRNVEWSGWERQCGTGGTDQSGSAQWCAAAQVFQKHCQTCHGSTPSFTAPMSLVTTDDLRRPSKTDPTRPVYQKVALRIDDPQSPMPPTSTGDTLTVQEKGAIKSWIDGGAVASDNASCNLMASPDGGTAGTTGEFTWPADCEQRYKILAHGKSDPKDTTKYNVSAQGLGKQWYQCFFFKPPWGDDKVQVLAFRPIIDNPKVIHHWIMYGNENGKQADGTVGGQGCNVGAFLQGWAPGSQGSGDLPSDVGLQMPSGPNVVLGLEVHYNNTANVPDAMDASGVEFCTTKKFRPKSAAVHWLGTMGLILPPQQTSNFTNTCTPTNTEPVHILSTSPHMHQLGTHATLVLNRKNGAKETLIDKPFNFADQGAYRLETILNPGDSLTSSCTFNNTTPNLVTFGENTENEMCFLFTTAYPAGALTMAGLGLGPNRCINGF